MRRCALLIAILIGLATSSASAATQLDFSIPASPKLAQIESQVQTQYINKLYLPSPSGRMPVQVQSCPGMEQYGGCFDYTARLIYLQPIELSGPGLGAWVVAHELGHYADTLVNGEDWYKTTPLRREFMDLVGMNAPWYPTAPAIGPVEAWADWYAHCSLFGLVSKGPAQLDTWRGYDFKLAPARYNRVCAFFSRVLVRGGFDAPIMSSSPAIPYNKTKNPDCAARPAGYEMNVLKCKWIIRLYGPHNRYQCFNADEICAKRINAWDRKHQYIKSPRRSR